MIGKHDDKVYKAELLDLLRRVDAVFGVKGIKYFAVYGTCLGAVREHGIIPWDDDIDIAVWRKDFALALQVLNESKEQIFAGDRNTVPGCPGRCGRIFNRVTSTASIEKKRAYIDLHIIDYAPESNLLFRWLVFWYVGISRIVDRRLGKKGNAHPTLYLLADIAAFPLRILPSGVLVKISDWIYRGDRSSSLVKITFDGNRKRYKAQSFSESIRCQFSGLTISVPGGYDEFLTKCYGDWRTPPPLNDRASHAFDVSKNVWNVLFPDDDARPLLK